MSATSDFYRKQAAECLVEAEAAKLDNVRQRYLRAEAVWRTMADKLTFAEAGREQENRNKDAARRLASEATQSLADS